MNTTTFSQLARLLAEKNLLLQTPSAPEAPSTAPAAQAELDQLELSGCDCDSRVAAPGHLFVCKGATFKPTYLAQAISQGAVAYLCEAAHAAELSQVAPQTPALIARDAQALRTAMGLASALCWGRPDHAMDVVGVTGTKGKSTVAYLLRSIVNAAYGDNHASIIGSIKTFDGVEDLESHNTTPEAPDLWRHLANANATGHTPMIMEVSSQALKYGRCLGLRLRAAGWLNIGRDHISPVEHSTFEDYFASKLKIFELSDTALINLETDHLPQVLEASARCSRRVFFSAAGNKRKEGQTPQLWATNISSKDGHLNFMCHTPAWTGPLTLAFPGIFNVDNALCAVAFALELGISYNHIAAGLSACRVPGRMELSPASTEKIVGLVDYAHNKLSFQKLGVSLKQDFPGKKIIAVFGAPGNKAYERRRDLPQEAAKWADHIIFTAEDPTHEDPADICRQMIANVPEGSSAEIVVDRTQAISRAVELAAAATRNPEYTGHTGAVVCMLAKGDEDYQHVGNSYEPMRPDEDVFAETMAKLGRT